MDLMGAIPIVRESVVAVFRYRTIKPQTASKGKLRPATYRVGWGSGFCIIADHYILTAFHVLNEGKPRNQKDRFIAFVVPANQDRAYHFPVTGFPVEKPEADLAILEIGPCTTAGVHVPAIPVSFAQPPDGSRVLTVGFPAPEVMGLNIDPQGDYHGGQFFLKSHGNEGILSAQYDLAAIHMYEFNVGWHHGESGGPVVRLEDPIAAFTIMQQYRNVQSPLGTVAGPHRGCALFTIRDDLVGLGAEIV